MKKHPYMGYEESAFWKRSVAMKAISEVDPVSPFPFRITKADKVATAGSCFAQHISRKLKEIGFNFYVTEDAHPVIRSKAQSGNYGIYSARYGNIYTARQLVQLFHRAYGNFNPKDDVWTIDEGALVDAFRPTIQEHGFRTWEELYQDRQQHYEAVRKCFEGLDYFVFTLGLTECWISKQDGAVYPVCPGVSGGAFDDSKYEFKNFRVDEVVSDFEEFIGLLRSVNPAAKIILTVSPVPLAATASGKHVLAATTLSKSVLRVAAEEICNKDPNTFYFPSYEIITGAYARGNYYAQDLRTVTEPGVNHVMSLFVMHGTDVADAHAKGESVGSTKDDAVSESFISEMKGMIDVMCDETALDPENNP